MSGPRGRPGSDRHGAVGQGEPETRPLMHLIKASPPFFSLLEHSRDSEANLEQSDN